MSKESEISSSFIAPSVEELSPLFSAYRIEGFIAQGGMGAVYKANQKSLDRPVAIKILPREFGDDAQFRASFEAEAKAMARLNHPNLIGVYDFGDVDGMLFIIMEYVQGKALFYSIHKKAIDPTIAINLICKVSRGIAHAHKGGILHRDIKPANILLDIDAEPKVGDFGLARPINAKRGEGLAFGTPGYTAPEVFNHQYDIDQRSDIFSVGAMLFELIKGRAPESNSTSMKTGLDTRLDAILSKATHPDPNQRHKDVDQLADQLEALAPKLSGPRFATAERPTSASPQAPITQLKSSKSSPVPALIVIALLLGGGAFALFKGLNEDEPETITPKTPEKPIVDKKSSKPKKDPKKDRQKPKVAKNNPKPSPKPKPDPDPVVTREKPLDSLLRLQGALAAGKLGELPVGAIKRGDSAFFLYRPYKTWPEAQALAENFGASLASAKNSDDLRFFRNSFKSEKTVWLGASDSGVEGKWYWMDGEPVSESFWAKASPDNDPEAARFGEDFAGLTSNGIEDFSGTGKCPAIFEWTLTEPNPGSLDAQLARTAASLATKSPPIFPASAFEFNGSRYLLLKRKLNYEDASQVATQAGGHLAVPSSQEEANHFVSLMNATLKEDESCWFGGRRSEKDSEIWETPTAEAFAFHKWLPDNPDYSHGKESALEYAHATWAGKKGFNDRVPEDAISYTLIEWSHPDLRNMAPVAADLSPILEKIEVIRTAIRDRHNRDYERYRRKKNKIISDWVKNSIKRIELDRTFPDALKAPVIATLKGYDKKHVLPKDLPPGAPSKIQRTFKEAKADILELWEEYEEEYDEAKADYIEALTRAMKTALSQGDATFPKFCQKEIDALEEKGRFGKILAGKDVVALPE